MLPFSFMCHQTSNVNSASPCDGARTDQPHYYESIITL